MLRHCLWCVPPLLPAGLAGSQDAEPGPPLWLAGSQEVLPEPDVEADFSTRILFDPINIFRGMRLVNRQSANPDDATLEAVLTPDLYARRPGKLRPLPNPVTHRGSRSTRSRLFAGLFHARHHPERPGSDGTRRLPMRAPVAVTVSDSDRVVALLQERFSLIIGGAVLAVHREHDLSNFALNVAVGIDVDQQRHVLWRGELPILPSSPRWQA